MTMRRFVVIDTESSVCRQTNLRILVSFAYEVVDEGGGVRGSHYDLVALPPGIELDRSSERFHGITAAATLRRGRALFRILHDFLAAMEAEQPVAMVGHDVVGDAALLVSEALRVGVPAQRLRALFLRLVCTKQLAMGHCCIPLPSHLRYDYPCPDALLHRLNGCVAAADPPEAPAPYKWPNLDECYQLLVRPEEHAPPLPRHDARGDVERCRLVLKRLLSDSRNP